MQIVRVARQAAVGFTLIASGPVMAQEACVVCNGPDQTYRCSIEKVDKVSRIGAPGDKAVQAVCAQEMARKGGHAKCVARRDAVGPGCLGVAVEIPIASLIDAVPLPVPASSPPATAVAATTPSDASGSEAPPRTMLELAERTGESSKKQLKKVGDGVGDAADRTWTCIASLFKKC